MNDKQTIDREQQTKTVKAPDKQIALPTGEYEMDIRADGSVLIRPRM